MTRATITHVLRAPIVGGSELETLEITRHVRNVHHRVLFPRRYAAWEPSIRDRFPAGVAVEDVPDLEQALRAVPGPVHLQFPFVLTGEKAGHETVLELGELPAVPTVFTVHAAVNVPIVDGLHYLFHSEELAARFAGIARERRTICPSLVEPPALVPATPREPGPTRVLWVSRNEDAKFNDRVPWICRRLLERAPEVHLRFVGLPARFALPADPRLTATRCPAADLESEYRSADVFWYYPHELLEETWCRTVTEALGHGLPCVTADWGSMRVQLRDDAGVCVHTAEECVEELVQLVRDARRRRALGVVARERARALFAEAHETLEKLYERLCAHGPK